ncbi:MAG TPA: hypothetical protein VME43_31180 [Bryobacteraceae bacterium]|nr:hypothetical protein [Bryobacteraceae bacterium]
MNHPRFPLPFPTTIGGRFLPALLVSLLSTAAAQTFDPRLWNDLSWRSLGPAAMGGRISGIAGVPGNPRLLYAGTGSGGLFKTVNGGVTWQALFERPETISIGDIAIDPKHPDSVWLGTGEANLRNSVSFGSGMYYSADGGKTWEHRGLEQTMTIARVALDPRDANRVFVAAVGHPFGPNPERGVFFSPDAGHTWQKVLYTDDRHGASDLEIDPSHPDVLFAGMWRFDRKPWRYDSGDDAGGLYKSSDGGKTWRKITRGLPALMGRIGVKVAPGNSRIVYVIAESREGTLFRSDDGGESFHAVSSNRALVARGYYYCDLRVDPKDADRVYVLESAIQVSEDGGKSFEAIGRSVHGDIQALWIDPDDPARMWQGSDGGLAFSWDGGDTWEHIASISLGQFYHVYADNRKPFYDVSGGTQDNGTWIGPSRTREPSGILNDDWRMVSSIVGFNVLSDFKDPDVLLTQTPGGTLLRTNLRSRDQQSVGPQVRSYSGSTAAAMKYRFAWDAPLVRSPHGQSTFYYGSNVIFQSSDKGETWEPISHDLTGADPSKWQPSGGPIFTDNSSSEVYGTVTRISESPAKRGVIWAGTDDGNVQVTVNGGGQWVNVAANIHDVAAKSPVSALETSHRDANTVYVAYDRHMMDDMQPYLFKTTDGGKTWKKITAGLPADAFVWVVREDPKNPDVVYLGTEVGLFASFDAGGHWARFGLKNLPNVAVRDVFVQAEQNDILLATHGRGLWILDDATPVQQMASAAAHPAYLFPIRPALRCSLRATRSGGGDTEFAAPNPPYGAILNYYLRQPVEDVRLTVLDSAGATIRTLSGGRVPHDAGIHRIAWDLRGNPPAGAPTGGRGGGARGPQVLPGVYTVRLSAGAEVSEQKVRVELDPELTVSADDLKAQWDTLESIGKLMSGVSGLLREADQHADSAAWRKLRDQLARPRGAPNSEAEPRLSEQLASLYNLVEAPNDAPTPAMTKLLAELQDEYQKAQAESKALQP